MSVFPARPNLSQLRHQAKDLHRACTAGEAAALHLFERMHPVFEGVDLQAIAAKARLQDAQLVLAREYGFQSWRAMVARVESTESRLILGGHIEASREREALECLEALNLHEEDLTHALGRAVLAGMCDVGDALIARGADVKGEGGDNGPILLGACEFLNPDGIRYLLERGAVVNIPAREMKYARTNTPMRMVLGTYERKADTPPVPGCTDRCRRGV